jgi:hypothetical protein
LQTTPATFGGELAEASSSWGLFTAINTAAKVNDLKFVVRNNDAGGKKINLNRIVAIVTHKEQ